MTLAIRDIPKPSTKKNKRCGDYKLHARSNHHLLDRLQLSRKCMISNNFKPSHNPEPSPQRRYTEHPRAKGGVTCPLGKVWVAEPQIDIGANSHKRVLRTLGAQPLQKYSDSCVKTRKTKLESSTSTTWHTLLLHALDDLSVQMNR